MYGTTTISFGANVTMNYLIVGGGGGGGTNGGGGGGGGGCLTGTANFVSGTTYTLTAGGGGAGAPANQSARGVNGSNSTITGSGFTTLTALGGGGGANRDTVQTPGTGGSGGGAGNTNASGAAGTAGQGFAGGSCVDRAGDGGGAGGGGGGAVGQDGQYRQGGVGGEGFLLTVANKRYAGGGGGGITVTGTRGAGGAGGGGAGGDSIAATNGTLNSGGGGGGGGPSMVGGTGGSGIIVLWGPTVPGSQSITNNNTSNTVVGATISGRYTLWTNAASNNAIALYENGSITFTSDVTATYLMVGGGGGGGRNGGGGGGGGAYLTGTVNLIGGQPYTYSIGPGGTGAPGDQSAPGAQGGTTSLSGYLVNLNAIGGGGGANRDGGGNATSGGSGGGGGNGPLYFAAGAGTSGQGFAGGSTSDLGADGTGGGGGGGAAVGGNGAYRQGGAGGQGYLFTPIMNQRYCGGGGGGVTVTGAAGAGGAGGGGAGGTATVSAQSGVNSTGGGGGGGGPTNDRPTPGNGGSGIIVLTGLRMPTFLTSTPVDVVTANMFLWVDASDSSTITLDGLNVVGWRDKASGLTYRPGAIGPVLTSAPTWDSDKTAVSFSNSSGGLTTSSQGLQLAATWVIPGPNFSRTSYFVLQWTRSVSTALRCNLRINGDAIYPMHSAIHMIHPNLVTTEHTRDMFFNSGSTSTNFTVNYTRSTFATNGTKYVVVVRSSATVGSFMYINGTLAASGTTGTITNTTLGPNTYNAVYLGAGVDNRAWDGFIHETRVYNDYHDDAERTAIQDHLRSKWNVTF